MKKVILWALLIFVIRLNAQERIHLNRYQLLAQEQHECDEDERKFRECKVAKGVRGILEYLPLCIAGIWASGDAFYQLANYENTCWVESPATQEYKKIECDFWIQFGVGFVAYMAGGACVSLGGVEICESGICKREHGCRACCTLCLQEWCGLLGKHYNR